MHDEGGDRRRTTFVALNWVLGALEGLHGQAGVRGLVIPTARWTGDPVRTRQLFIPGVLRVKAQGRIYQFGLNPEGSGPANFRSPPDGRQRRWAIPGSVPHSSSGGGALVLPVESIPLRGHRRPSGRAGVGGSFG
jgi:hypothetical protein